MKILRKLYTNTGILKDAIAALGLKTGAYITKDQCHNDLVERGQRPLTDHEKETKKKLTDDFKKKNGNQNYAELNLGDLSSRIIGNEKLKDKIEKWRNLPEEKKKELREKAKRELGKADRSSKKNAVCKLIGYKFLDQGANFSKPLLVINKKNGNVPEVIAHEIGHEKYKNKDEDVSTIGKIAHNDMPRRKIPNIVLGSVGAFSGAKRAYSGKGHGVKSHALGVGLALGNNVGPLVREALASKQGIKKLRDAGATEEEIKNYKKTLKSAYGTYGANVLNDLSEVYIGRTLGKGGGIIAKSMK